MPWALLRGERMESIQIKTATGESYPIKWAGVSSIDGTLNFALIINITISKAARIFGKKESTSKLIYEFDGKTAAEYEGYTELTGINMNTDGSIVITLAKAKEE